MTNPGTPAMFKPADYLDLSKTEHMALFEGNGPVWDALSKIESYLKFRLKPAIHGKLIGRPFVSNLAYIGEGTTIEHGATILGPAWIGRNCRIRSGCYIRQSVIVGDGVVLGNSCEFKNCLILDEAQIPHFNYVGDSILGHRAHLGAGVILSNVRLDHRVISVRAADGPVATQLRKFGAIIGDNCEIGCNSVISPGSLIGRSSIIHPCTHWNGVLPANSVASLKQDIHVAPRNPAPR